MNNYRPGASAAAIIIEGIVVAGVTNNGASIISKTISSGTMGAIINCIKLNT